MGFFDKIRKGKLFFGKEEPSTVVEFIFGQQRYIVEKFDIEFRQDVNSGNRPDSETYGGLVTVTFSDMPDEYINRWIMNSFEKRNGEFRFLLNDKKIMEGAVLHLIFKDAYCVNYQKVMDTSGAGVSTTLIISPRYIKIGNEEFENRWRDR